MSPDAARLADPRDHYRPGGRVPLRDHELCGRRRQGPARRHARVWVALVGHARKAGDDRPDPAGRAYTPEERRQIVEYCWLDTNGLAALLPRIVPDILARPNGWAFALL